MVYLIYNIELTVVDVAEQRDWDTEDGHEDVGDGEVGDEVVVGDVPHARRADDDEHDHGVADEGAEEDGGVGHGVDGDHVVRLFDGGEEQLLRGVVRIIHIHVTRLTSTGWGKQGNQSRQLHEQVICMLSLLYPVRVDTEMFQLAFGFVLLLGFVLFRMVRPLVQRHVSTRTCVTADIITTL